MGDTNYKHMTGILALVAVTAVGGCVAICLMGSHDPGGLCVLAGTCVGAILTLLLRARPDNGDRPKRTDPPTSA